MAAARCSRCLRDTVEIQETEAKIAKILKSERKISLRARIARGKNEPWMVLDFMNRNLHNGISELAEASRQRLADAKALLNASRWRGAMYIGGYAVECLLKTKLMHIYDCKNLSELEDCTSATFYTFCTPYSLYTPIGRFTKTCSQAMAG